MDRRLSDEEIGKRRKKRFLRLAVLIVGLMGLAIAVYSFSRTTVDVEEMDIAVVGYGDIEPSVAATGIVVPAVEEMIVSPIGSRILQVLHQSGDLVEEGTPLMLLDTQDVQNEYRRMSDELQMSQSQLRRLKVNNKTALEDISMKIKVAEMKLDRLEAELRNERYLDSLGSGTHDRVKEVEFSCNTSRLELEQLRQQRDNEKEMRASDEYEKQLEINIAERNLAETRRLLEDARIRSPRQAVITYILDEVGAQVPQGCKLAVVSDLNHFKVNATIADTYSEYVSSGAKVTVKIGSDKIDGIVGNVSPQSSDGTIAFTVVLHDDNHKRLRSGLKADVYVASSVKRDVLSIPNASYYVGSGEYIMFVMADETTLEKRIVRLGECSYDKVEVINGLEAGDRVVISDMKKFQSVNSIEIK